MVARQPIASMRLPCAAGSGLRLVGQRIGWPAIHPALNLTFLQPARPASVDPAPPAHWLHLLYHLIRSVELRIGRPDMQRRRESHSAPRLSRPGSLAPGYPLRRRKRMQLPSRMPERPVATGQMGAAGVPHESGQSSLFYLFRSADAAGVTGMRGGFEGAAQRLVLLASRARSEPSRQSLRGTRRPALIQNLIERSHRTFISPFVIGAAAASGQPQQTISQRLTERGNRRPYATLAADSIVSAGRWRRQTSGRTRQFDLQQRREPTAAATPKSRVAPALRFVSRQSGPLRIAPSAAARSQQLTQTQLRQYRYLAGSDVGRQREPGVAVFHALHQLFQRQRHTGRQHAAPAQQQARVGGRRRQRQDIRPTAVLSAPSPRSLVAGNGRHRPSMLQHLSQPGAVAAASSAIPAPAAVAAAEQLSQLGRYRPGPASALAFRQSNQVRQADVQRQIERIEHTVHTKVVREIMHHSHSQQQVRGAVEDALLSPQLLQSLARKIHATIEQRAAIDRYRKGGR
ncbi:hypothetical protein [Paraherbaspirillum soli]|uniref:Uncharacterized protein n=1 Tax=Paraherbaspirillum soli TaxID=631222 RepID=A0ABW0MBF9_9BURK